MVRVRCVLIRSILNWIDALKKKKINYEIGIIKILTSSLELNKKTIYRFRFFTKHDHMYVSSCLHCFLYFILFFFRFRLVFRFCSFLYRSVSYRSWLFVVFFSIQFLFNLFCCFFFLIVNLVCFFDPVTLFSCTRI